jgi:hypothetical protein
MMRPIHLRLPALCLPLFFGGEHCLFFGGKQFLPFDTKARMRMYRENDIARTIRPREAGQGNHWSSRSERTMVEGRRALLSVQEDYSGGAISFYSKANEQA